MKTVNISVTEAMAKCPYCKNGNFLYPDLSRTGPIHVDCEFCGKKFDAEMDTSEIEF